MLEEREEINMRVSMMSLSPKRARMRTILWLVFSIVLLSNMAGIPFTTSIVYASSMDTPQLLSDVNDDGVLDMWDIAAVAWAYGTYPGHEKWNSRADLNNDDFVDIFDLALVVQDCDAHADIGVGRLWSADSYWYKRIPEDAPLHPKNDQMINWLMDNHNDYPGIQWRSWTNVFYYAYEDTRVYSVYVEQRHTYKNIPFPDPYPIQIPADDDGGVTIIDWHRGEIWQMWRVRAQGEGYIAGNAYPWPMYGSGMGVLGTWSTGGSGSPKAAYVIRPEEIEAGVINHPLGCALRVIGPSPDGSRYDMYHGFVHPPATHTDREVGSTNPYEIPEGARIQLDPTIDLDSLSLSRTGKIIAKCMQDYGIVCVEAGGSWHIYAEHDLTADWNPPEMSGNLMSALGDLTTSTYNPWRIVDYSVFGASLF